MDENLRYNEKNTELEEQKKECKIEKMMKN